MLSEKLRNAALEYAEMGFSVFPLSSYSKQPHKGTHGLNDATTDRSTIQKWWSEWPESNIGINCGMSGLVILDVDVKGGKDARPAVADKDLTGAVYVTTPSGGHHYYWKTGGTTFQTGASLYGYEGLDVRAVGGYVVAPPSLVTHTDGVPPQPYTIVSGDFAHIGNAPQWLVECERARQSKRCDRAQSKGGEGVVAPDDYQQERIEQARGYVAKMPEAISGRGGHIALLKAATALVVGFRLTDEDALEVLRNVYNPRCQPPWNDRDLEHKVSEARANKTSRNVGYLLEHGLPFCNYIVVTRTDEQGEGQKVRVPKKVREICEDILRRFGGYPKRLGDTLFDYREGEQRINPIDTKDALTAWAALRGDCLVDFLSKPGGYPSMGETFAALRQTAQRYEAVSSAPFWPDRKDLFPLYGTLPQADPRATAFWGLLSYMCPATDEDKYLMAAFFVAPLYYSATNPRPCWTIDTEDAQASGKTTVVNVCAKLYDCQPVSADFATLDRKEQDLKKRLISSVGRSSRIVLFDNVVGKAIRSPALANFVTAKSITERAAYGRGEESRPNDLTWCITINGATFDSDMASRSYTLKVRKPSKTFPWWESEINEYIDSHRKQIMADMIHMLEAVAARPRNELWTRSNTRFPMFDSLVLAAVCGDKATFDKVDAYLSRTVTEANVEIDDATLFVRTLERSIKESFREQTGEVYVILNDGMSRFLQTIPALQRQYTVKDVRRWVKSDMLPMFDKDFSRLQNSRVSNEYRRSGFLYRPIGEYMTQSTQLQPVKVIQPNTDDGKVESWVVIYETNIARQDQ